MAYIVMQYARFLTFKCQDPNRAVEILNQAINKIPKASKALYLNYINFLKHIEGTVPDVFSKIVSIFEKAIDEQQGGLKEGDRVDMAKYYLEYMNESCMTVGVIRKTEQALKEKKLIHLSQTKRDLLNAGPENEEKNGTNGYGGVLGKRDYPENGFGVGEDGETPNSKRERYV